MTGEGVTDREAAYLATLAVLFGEGDKEDRDDAYADAMADLARQYPRRPLTPRTFYALALLGTAHEGRDFTTYMKAAAVLEGRVRQEPPPPPARPHYLIHAYDDPVHAPLGLRPALVYADVAPAASHALHMPSHIYLALGMWPETADMNRRSYDAALAASTRRGEGLNGHGWHALWWRHYAATQLDDRPLADSLLTLAQIHYVSDPNPTAGAHVVRIAAQHATAYFEPVSALDARLPGPASETTDAIRLLAQGWLALRRDDTADARRIADDLNALVSASDDPAWSVRSAALQLDGLVRVAEDDRDGGLARLREAARVESEAPLTFGPPAPVVPSNEALGLMEMQHGDPEAGRAAFRSALDRAPNRRQSVEGLAEAERRRANGEG